MNPQILLYPSNCSSWNIQKCTTYHKIMIKYERLQCWIQGLQLSFIASEVYGYCHMKGYKPIVILTFSSNWHSANVLTLLIYGIGWFFFFFPWKNKPSESLSLETNLRTERNESNISRFLWKKSTTTQEIRYSAVSAGYRKLWHNLLAEWERFAKSFTRLARQNNSEYF